MPATARHSARISENDTANLPNDFGKSRRRKIMGGMGSGRGQGGKGTTSDMRSAGYSAAASRWPADTGPGLRLAMDGQRREVVINPDAVGSRAPDSQLSQPKPRRRVATDGIPGLSGMDGLHLGGRRAWFLCPAKGCGRRVAILFGGSIFACRHCHKLAYECQREPDDDRAARRADTIRRRLGWGAGIAEPGRRQTQGDALAHL